MTESDRNLHDGSILTHICLDVLHLLICSSIYIASHSGESGHTPLNCLSSSVCLFRQFTVMFLFIQLSRRIGFQEVTAWTQIEQCVREQGGGSNEDYRLGIETESTKYRKCCTTVSKRTETLAKVRSTFYFYSS